MSVGWPTSFPTGPPPFGSAPPPFATGTHSFGSPPPPPQWTDTAPPLFSTGLPPQSLTSSVPPSPGAMDTSFSDYVDNLFFVRVLTTAGYSILVHDYTITFADEVRYIWCSRWSLVKCLFLVNRYGNLCVQALVVAQTLGWSQHNSPAFCFVYTMVNGILNFLLYASIHVLLLLRVWVLWGQRRRMLITLVMAFIMYATLSITLLIYGTVLGGESAYYFTDAVGTCLGPIPPWAWVLWLPGLILEIMTFVFTFLTFRDYIQGQLHSPLIIAIYREGAIYFTIAVLNASFCMIIWGLYPYTVNNLLANVFGMMLLTVTGQRLVLELRKLGDIAGLSTRSRADRAVDRALQGVNGIGDGQLVFEMNPYASYGSAAPSRYVRPHADVEYEEAFVPVAGPSQPTDEHVAEPHAGKTQEYDEEARRSEVFVVKHRANTRDGDDLASV